MINKKILIVCKYFYPEISPRAFRATELALEFARNGHDVTILLPIKRPNASALLDMNTFKIMDIGRLRFTDIDLIGNKVLLLIKRFFKRGLNLIFEFPDIELFFKVGKVLKTKDGYYDLVVSIAVPYPIHWGVAYARNKNHKIAKTWIADCGDPYMGCQTDSFRKLFYFKYIEKWFCRKADYITVPTKQSISAYYPEFHNKIKVIPQGFYMENLNLPAYKKNIIPVFAYSGGFIPGKRDPGKFLDFLSGVKHDFKFIIYTTHRAMIEGYIARLKGKLIIKDYIPREELLSEMAKMDFLVNFDNNISVQLPSKLIDYSLTGRPVLNITSDFDPETVKEFISGNYSKKMIFDNVEQYNIKNVARQFLDLAI